MAHLHLHVLSNQMRRMSLAELARLKDYRFAQIGELSDEEAREEEEDLYAEAREARAEVRRENEGNVN